MRIAIFTMLIALASICTAGAAPPAVGPAPAGPANIVAARIVKNNFPQCDGVSGAMRLPDGSIKATCNGVDYRVFTVTDPKNGEVLEVAMNCNAAKELLGVSC